MRFLSLVLTSCLVCISSTPLACAGSLWAPFKYKTFREPGLSMQPGIGVGDVVYVDMTYFRSNPPEVGQVVLYRPEELDRPTVKRVVAIGPATLRIEDGTLIVNGESVPEPYLKQGGAATSYSRNWGPEDLKPGCIFLLGDYRDHSMDSRTYGCSTKDDLLGLVKYVVPASGSRTFEGAH